MVVPWGPPAVTTAWTWVGAVMATAAATMLPLLPDADAAGTAGTERQTPLAMTLVHLPSDADAAGTAGTVLLMMGDVGCV